MSALHDGGPAFPKSGHVDHDGFRVDEQQGMTLRDWFAGQALGGAATRGFGQIGSERAATQAYKLADAMLAARCVGGAS